MDEFVFAAFSSLLDIHTERLVLTIELTCVHSAPCVKGPEFTELADDLQEAFQTYVEKECGIDGDVAAFIAMYADYREQEEYVDWMKTAVGVLA